jgi:hypothetical protein
MAHVWNPGSWPALFRINLALHWQYGSDPDQLPTMKALFTIYFSDFDPEIFLRVFV